MQCQYYHPLVYAQEQKGGNPTSLQSPKETLVNNSAPSNARKNHSIIQFRNLHLLVVDDFTINLQEQPTANSQHVFRQTTITLSRPEIRVALVIKRVPIFKEITSFPKVHQLGNEPDAEYGVLLVRHPFPYLDCFRVNSEDRLSTSTSN